MTDIKEITWPGGRYEPLQVALTPVKDVWAHRTYVHCSLEREVAEHRRPTDGILATDPTTGAYRGLVVRMPPDPPGERLQYTCLWTRGDEDDAHIMFDMLVESRRWIGIRTLGTVMRATPSLNGALRDTLRMHRRVRNLPPEAVPEGDDLTALEGLV